MPLTFTVQLRSMASRLLRDRFTCHFDIHPLTLSTFLCANSTQGIPSVLFLFLPFFA